MGMGAMDKESSFKLLDAYFDAGGNFIEGTSEMFIGEWAEMHGIRDQLYTANFKRSATDIAIEANYVGNNAKSLKISVEASLKELRTSYIDILLHHLVATGKVLYLGVSDSPAWVVSAANQYAKLRGKSPFVIYQGSWNVMDRSFEREIIPMARANGLALAPWNVLAAGHLRTDAEEERRLASGEKGRTLLQLDWMHNENENLKKMSAALEKVAKEVGTEHISTVAIVYVMQKTPYVFPIIGGCLS
ncbi:Aldo/keto reductase [Fomitiporia mediterranea MF3/22]|uniref:Aldo/keto reductase n=1 Tax=Fomitiporia mediterranea (strain MF3/22) TaxID=694068 RepID=UPI0004409734|nr:Aldo/keto reductase [Fomitiporia mediterranea MF3/22]EJD04749.1 Aldo/keto reductase [Fomitiporia mediterranea MF3/22]